MTARIIGFEGPSLAGKTTLIRRLEKRLRARGISVLHVEEFTILVGGHTRFPPLLTADRDAALRGVRFFLEVEQQRRQQIDEWLATQDAGSLAFVLVDRLIFTCMAVRRAVKDDVGYQAYLSAVLAREVILPDLTLFIGLTCPDDELKRRMEGRILFEHWEVLYNPPGYLEVLREIDSTVVPLNLCVANADDLEGIERLLLSLQ